MIEDHLLFSSLNNVFFNTVLCYEAIDIDLQNISVENNRFKTNPFELRACKICHNWHWRKMGEAKVFCNTCFFCPILWALAMACRSFWGFQSLSKITTVSAVARLIPRPPARVDRRKQKSVLPSALKWSSAWALTSPLTPPSSRWKEGLCNVCYVNCVLWIVLCELCYVLCLLDVEIFLHQWAVQTYKGAYCLKAISR